MSDGVTETPDILHGDDPPGQWREGSVSGRYITWRLPKGVAVGEFVPLPHEVVELVVSVDGDRHGTTDSERPVEVWVVAYDPDRIIPNYRTVGTTITETVGVESGAKAAAAWMEEYDGR